jgi:hypothetical protein
MKKKIKKQTKKEELASRYTPAYPGLSVSDYIAYNAYLAGFEKAKEIANQIAYERGSEGVNILYALERMGDEEV